MRLLIHYVGDVHQPLHATARVDHEYPRGDFGGNTVHLPNKDESLTFMLSGILFHMNSADMHPFHSPMMAGPKMETELQPS